METVVSNKTNWYTLRVANTKENRIKEVLPSIEGYDKYISQVLVPHEKIVKIKDGKKIFSEKNLLPGYVLIEFKTTYLDPDFIKNVETIKYVSGFLKTSTKELISLRRNEIQNIIGSIEEIDEKVSLPVIGEDVMIIDGPFKGFKGNITKLEIDKQTVDVNVKVFGRDTSVSLNLIQIEKESN
jgi:transcriptional antiterminator NusG